MTTATDHLAIVIDPTEAVAEGDETNNANQGAGLDQASITYFPWDINNNGHVTATDAIFVINRLGTNNAQADLDGNGLVTATDAIGVINRLGYQAPATASSDSTRARK